MFLRPALAAALLVMPAIANAQALTPAETTRIDGIVTSALAKTGVPSASIAVVRRGRIVLAKAYGKASDAIPHARPDLPYQIASISKQFTAAAVLLLEDRGKLSLDDTVAKYLPGITDGDHITLRQLLSHTSGLQDYWPQDYAFAAMERPIDPQGIVDRWAKKPLDFAPGTQWQYSNTGYVVAGLIVEKVSGQPLLDFLKTNIFQPLDITAYDQDKAVGPKFPQAYHRYALGPVRAEQPPARGWLFAAGELAMSASDLAKWDIARIDRTTLSADDWAVQETSVKLIDGTDPHYGLGVEIGSFNGHRMIEHSGEAIGFLSENMVFPDDRTAIVVFTNSDFSNAYVTMAQAIARTVLPPASGTPATDETVKTAQARAVFDSLRVGTLDRSTQTANSNFYFTSGALADYKVGLSKLGVPTRFEPARPAKLRGGFVNRTYRATYPDRSLTISTYAEPGPTGRYEQFLIMPANDQ